MTGVLQVQGTGQLKAIVDRVFEKRATERAAQFASSLEQRFAENPAARAGPAPRRGWLRRVYDWLRRLTSSS
jgi:hypothetical protein